MVLLEVCANSARSAIAAQAGGAIRAELCDNLQQGGTTPSHGQILLARKALNIKLYVLIRPRNGDFLYTDEEFEIMLADVKHCIDLGCDGIVTGILNSDGSVDMQRNRQLVDLTRRNGLGATFHRAFDVCADMEKAMEDIIAIGFERILTSGGKATAPEGTDKTKELIRQADNRILIMPGSGINESNVARLVQTTGAIEIHSSARVTVQSKMRYKTEQVSMGGNFADEYVTDITDAEIVRKLIKAANN